MGSVGSPTSSNYVIAPLSSLPLNELLEPIGKPEKDDSEHGPTKNIEDSSEREHVEYVRKRRTNKRSDVEVPSAVHAYFSMGRAIILF